MVHLSSAVLMRVQRFLLDLHAAGSVEALRRVIPAGAAQLISSDRPNFNEFDVGEGKRLIVPSPVPAYWERLSPVFLAHIYEHPVANQTRVPPQHRAFTFSDYHNDPSWKKSTLYHEYYLPAGARNQLFVHVFERGTSRCGLAFNRECRDFSAHDRAVLELISPHVACAWQNALELSRLRQEHSTDVVPTSRVAAPELSGLTRRENEILHWISEGKRNSEIATILELSPRTVGKHLEHVFEKLGVETRTAAARTAIERGGTRDA